MVTPTEYLLDNYVEKEFQNVINPLFWSHLLSVSSYFFLRDNFITPTTKLYKFISILINVALLIAYCLNRLYTVFYDINQTAKVILIIGMSIRLGEIIVILVIYVRSESFIQLIQKIQIIDRKLGSSKHGINYARHKKMVWSLFSIVLGSNAVSIIINTLISKKIISLNNFFASSRVFLDVNIIYSIFILDFLSVKLKIWCSHVALFIGERVHDGPANGLKLDVMEPKLCLDVYKDILDAVRLTEQIFAFSILYYVIELFGFTMIYVQTRILNVPYFTSFIEYDALVFFITKIKYFCLIAMLCIQSEKLNAKIKQAKAFCLVILKKHQSVEVRRMCKNVMRVSASRYSELNACGLFPVNATLPLRLVGLVATYTVVMLQFAPISGSG